MRGMLLPMLCLLLVAFPYEAGTFEVDGFRAGMSKETVMSTIKQGDFYTVQKKEHMVKGTRVRTPKGETKIIAWKAHEDGHRTGYFLTLCNGKLVHVTKDITPSMENFIKAFHLLSKRHGQPGNTYTDPGSSKQNTRYVISFSWNAEDYIIKLSYLVFPESDQLYVDYKTPSDCPK